MKHAARPWSPPDPRAPISGGRPTSSVKRSPKPRQLHARPARSWAVPRARPDHDASSWVPSAVCRSSSISSDRPTRSPTGRREDARPAACRRRASRSPCSRPWPAAAATRSTARSASSRDAVDVLLRAVERRLVGAGAGHVGHRVAHDGQARRRGSCGCGRPRGSPPPACASSGRQASAGLIAQSCESRPSRYASESRNTPFTRTASEPSAEARLPSPATSKVSKLP